MIYILCIDSINWKCMEIDHTVFLKNFPSFPNEMHSYSFHIVKSLNTQSHAQIKWAQFFHNTKEKRKITTKMLTLSSEFVIRIFYLFNHIVAILLHIHQDQINKLLFFRTKEKVTFSVLVALPFKISKDVSFIIICLKINLRNSYCFSS